MEKGWRELWSSDHDDDGRLQLEFKGSLKTRRVWLPRVTLLPLEDGMEAPS